WKCWKLSLKNFILRSSKSGGCQDDFFGLVSSFKLPHNGKGLCEVRATATEISRGDRTLAKTIFIFSNLQKK
ncbi:hypothetical protein, partial [Flavobacterium sp.]|uniref:hypothetical protein n=1 Tax=Flavobacterium sp. TaxID=239 RepID=UPI0035AF8FD2